MPTKTDDGWTKDPEIAARADLAEMEPVESAMARPALSIEPGTSAAVADALAKRYRVNHLPVVARGVLVGVVCRCDVCWVNGGVRVSDLMSTVPITIDSLARLSAAAMLMRTRNVGCLPVVDDGLLLGIITRGDLRRAGLTDPALSARRCLLCGSRHHVRQTLGFARPGLCLDCLAGHDPKVLADLLESQTWRSSETPELSDSQQQNVRADRRILVVDDDPDIRESLGSILTTEGYHVDLAENGLGALERLRAPHPPDLMILDLMMPVFSGFDLLQQIDADLSGAEGGPPILVISAYRDPLLHGSLRRHVRRFLAKPFDVRGLLEEVETCWRAHDRPAS